jgi:NAD(P)H-nitrite reductase large subunit
MFTPFCTANSQLILHSVAIALEERYKGIRSPHKIKGGVSGCVRECAEAQSKDFGVIATDRGWNGM